MRIGYRPLTDDELAARSRQLAILVEYRLSMLVRHGEQRKAMRDEMRAVEAKIADVALIVRERSEESVQDELPLSERA